MQHGVKALDGGDADAADAVELRGLQVLDVVKLGEFVAIVGRDELLELIRAADAHPSGLSFGRRLVAAAPIFQGLVAEVAAVVLVRLIVEFLHEARKIAEI